MEPFDITLLKNLWNKRLKPILSRLNFLRSFLFVVSKFDFTLLVGIIGILAFSKADQAKDLFNDLAADGIPLYITIFTFFITIWAVLMWFVPRFVLRLTKITAASENNKWETFFIKWIPRILGMLPFVVVVTGFLNAHSKGAVLYAICYAALGLLTFFYFVYRRSIYVTLKGEAFADKYAPLNRFSVEKDSFWSVVTLPLNRGIILLIISLNILFFLLATLSADSFFIFLKPGSVLALGFAGWTGLGIIIDYISNRYRFPVLVGLFIVGIVFSFFNNNHALRTSDRNPQIVESRPDFNTYLHHWLQHHSKSNTASQDYPVFIVASEGGGIRSTYWTLNLLAQMEAAVPGFSNHLFAMSGVSGGNLGETFYQALLADGGASKLNMPEISHKLASFDYLSPITSALLYPDLAQRFIPYHINRWDRARWLEDEFGYQYQSLVKASTLDNGFLELWQNPDKTTRYDLPCLFLNATHSESGRKAVFSNLRLDSAYFPDVVDVFAISKSDILLKAATSSCARFPILTPPALLQDGNGDWGHLVDGGYYENTGLETAFQLFRFIKNYNKYGSFEGMDSLKGKLRPIIIFIQNGDVPYSFPVIKNGYEFGTITSAFLNAWGRSGVARDGLTKGTVNDFAGPDYFKFQLDRKSKVNLPLGWYLSNAAKTELQNQVNRVFKPVSKQDTLWYKNYNAIKAALQR